MTRVVRMGAEVIEITNEAVRFLSSTDRLRPHLGPRTTSAMAVSVARVCVSSQGSPSSTIECLSESLKGRVLVRQWRKG